MKVIKATGDIANDDLRALYERWMSLPREGRVLPHPEQVTGAFLGEICGYCKVSKPLFEPFDVEYLYLGGAVKKLYSSPIENVRLSAIFDPWIRKIVTQTYQLSLDEMAAVYDKKGISTIIGSIGYEYLILPFSRSGTGVDLFVTCVFPMGTEIETSAAWEEAVANTPWLNA